MSFLLPCPNCGPRDVYEFRFGGEHRRRPTPEASTEAWVDYLYLRTNEAGVQKEWWYHRLGCRSWFLALRDTRSNAVLETTSEGGAPTPSARVPAPSDSSPRGCAGEAGARDVLE